MAPSTTKKQFKKVGQKKATPPETDPLRIFYSSTYKQNRNSTMSIKWLLEHGVFGPKTAEKMAMILAMDRVRL